MPGFRDPAPSPPPMLRVLRDVRQELLRAPPALTPERVRFLASTRFVRSGEWVRLRYAFMRDHDGRCSCCGRTAADGAQVNVDHILPRRTHPQFALAYGNLQVLCSLCNHGKGSRDRTDWRFRKPSGAALLAPLCDACQVPMVRRRGRHGPFWGCASFPTCRFTRPDEDRARAASPETRRAL